jgi:dTMP kinase
MEESYRGLIKEYIMNKLNVSRGLFITFEGGEGSGKSTQSKLLAKAIQEAGLTSIHTREPGGTEGAEAIRALLVQGDTNRWTRDAELLLHFAARTEHVSRLVIPQCEQGTHVICDRFTDSTIAYQGYGHGIAPERIRQLQRLILEGFSPNLTFMLDIDVQKGLARAGKRGDTENRYESMEVAFHERVRRGYLSIARKNSKRCVVLDADESIAVLHHKIIDRVNEQFHWKLAAALPVE